MAYLDQQSSIDSYYSLCQQGQVYCAYSAITAPTAYSTAATTGIVLYNGSGTVGNVGRVKAVILGVGIGWTTAPTATGAMGLAWGTTTAPTSTTNATAVTNMQAGIIAAPSCVAYKAATVSTAAVNFLTTHSISTAGSAATDTFQQIDGLVQAGPGGFISVCAAAAISTLVAQVSLVWAEIPL